MKTPSFINFGLYLPYKGLREFKACRKHHYVGEKTMHISPGVKGSKIRYSGTQI